MDVLVSDEWYKYYKQWEENLEKIQSIMRSDGFKKIYYNEKDKKLDDGWNEYMISIFDLTLCTLSREYNPEEKKEIGG